MKRFKKILVATDTRLEEHPIVSEAAEIAQHNGASLKIVDVVPEFAWTVRMTLTDHEHVRDLVVQEKQKKLESLAATIRDEGVQVETKVLKGKTSIEIIREVLQENHDLVLRVAKGRDSTRKGFFGNTGFRLLRQCPCAVWLVAPNTTPKFEHVMGCIDTSSGDERDAELNDKVYELASSISRYHDGRVSIVHAWSIYGEQMIKARMKPDEFQELATNTQHQVEQLLDAFLQKHGTNVHANNVHMVKGEAPEVISEFVRTQEVALIVMGTIARSGVAGAIIGNTAEQILNRIECSVLAVKPHNFVCPIRL